MLALVTSLAFAEPGDPNRAPQVTLALVRQGSGWGVEFGAGMLYALGDHCTWRETDCRRSDPWALAGPRVAASWRGGARFGLWVDGMAGGGAVDMHQVAFFPTASVFATAGLGWEVGEPLGWTIGATASKSLSLTVPAGAGMRTLGEPALALEAGVRVRFAGLRPAAVPWRVGFATATATGVDYM